MTDLIKVGDNVSVLDTVAYKMSSQNDGVYVFASDLKATGILGTATIEYDAYLYSNVFHEGNLVARGLYNEEGEAWVLMVDNPRPAFEAV